MINFVRQWCSLVAFLHQKCVRSADNSAFIRAACHTAMLKNAIRVSLEQKRARAAHNSCQHTNIEAECMDRRKVGVAGAARGEAAVSPRKRCCGETEMVQSEPPDQGVVGDKSGRSAELAHLHIYILAPELRRAALCARSHDLRVGAFWPSLCRTSAHALAFVQLMAHIPCKNAVFLLAK